MERITSRQHAVVKRFRELARSATGTAGTDVLLDGLHLVREALDAGVAIPVAAFADRQLRNGDGAEIASAVARGGGRVYSASDSVFAAMSPVQHPSGAVAIGRASSAHLNDAFEATMPLVLVLAGIQDPGNVGAIVRTAAALGASGVVAIEGSADPFGWKALRGAMGGTFRLPVAARGSILGVIAAARDRYVRLVAAVPRGGAPLPSADFRRPTALLLGGEGAGITDTLLAAADATVTVPMGASVESLNVGVAAALLLYEAARQRGTLA